MFDSGQGRERRRLCTHIQINKLDLFLGHNSGGGAAHRARRRKSPLEVPTQDVTRLKRTARNVDRIAATCLRAAVFFRARRGRHAAVLLKLQASASCRISSAREPMQATLVRSRRTLRTRETRASEKHARDKKRTPCILCSPNAPRSDPEVDVVRERCALNDWAWPQHGDSRRFA